VTRSAIGLAVVGLGASLAPLDIAVNIALPAISRHFGLALGDVQWLVICYVLVYGSLMLVCGKLGDVFGHRLIFRIGLFASAFGCAACAAAPDWPLFLWARVGQGVGTALALSCAPALATSLYPESSRTRALSAFVTSQAIAAAVGPLLGGALVSLWDWPAVYWMRVPVALLALACSGILPSPKPDERPFDGWGAALLASTMSALLLALALAQRHGMKLVWPAGLAAAALAGAVVFVRRENRFAEPILRPRLFADPAFAVPNVMNVLANLAAFAILLLTPFYLLQGLGLSPVLGGSMLAISFAGGMAGAPLAAFAVPAIGRRPAAFTGLLVMALSLLAMGFNERTTPLWIVLALLFVEGIGNGLLNVAYTDIVTGTLARRDRGVAGSLSLLTRTLGVVSGAAVLSALYAKGASGASGADAFMAGYRFAFQTAAGGLLLALAISCLAWPGAWFRR
jgi:MFS family permease